MLPEKSLYYELLHMNNSQKRSVWRWKKKMCVRQIIFIFRMWIFTPRQLSLHSFIHIRFDGALEHAMMVKERKYFMYVENWKTVGTISHTFTISFTRHLKNEKEHIKVNEMHVKNKWKMFVKRKTRSKFKNFLRVIIFLILSHFCVKI